MNRTFQRHSRERGQATLEMLLMLPLLMGVFFLGLAIALQSRRSSRLELARSLAWLAAFGIIYSLFEWGELFSPFSEVQAAPSARRVDSV